MTGRMPEHNPEWLLWRFRDTMAGVGKRMIAGGPVAQGCCERKRL